MSQILSFVAFVLIIAIVFFVYVMVSVFTILYNILDDARYIEEEYSKLIEDLDKQRGG